jgi:hypothetical protein
MQYLQLIKAVLSLLPLLIEVVRAIEAALPDSGQGQAKLSLVRAAVEAGYGAATDAVVSFEKLWPALESTIGAVVSAFNSVGAFKKES